MHFVSFSFALLLGAALLARLTIGRTAREPGYLALLLVLSVLFYAWHVPAYLVLIVTSTVVDYWAGLALAKPERSPAARRAVLGASLAVNLGLLGYFKYAGFFVEELHALARAAGLELSLPVVQVLLPMGISFYTFQSLSYTIDVYRGALGPTRSFSRFFLFVGFFPQLVAGPIVRAREFLYQLDRLRRPRARVVGHGLYLMVRGYFLKMVLADNLGAIVDQHWDAAAAPGAGAPAAALVTLLFSFQIFCDFAGYSSIARGVAYLLGFRLPVNFRSPYIAATFSDFWRRWHVTLSQWLRDYLYVPLGGNRRGQGRTMLNLFLVMLLGGLWHGAGMHFVAWGALHGVALLVERALGLHRVDDAAGRHRAGAPAGRVLRLGWFLVVQSTVLVAWIFFRAADVDQALAIVANLGRWEAPAGALRAFPVGLGLLLLLPAVAMHLRTLVHERLGVRLPGVRESAAWAALMLYFTLTAYGTSDAFIYFQF